MSRNDSGNSSKASKLGRKGDPRMHRAVSARLANPEISLFDALRIGGFDYPSNDDASVVDSEKVTLGQRKNQLSRRLRLAKKQQDGDKDNNTDAGRSSSPDLSQTSGNNRRGNPPATNGRMIEMPKDSSKLMQASVAPKPGKDNNHLGARALQMKQDHPDLSLPEYDGDLDGSIDIGQETAPKRQRIAKFHPDYAPLFVPPPSRNSFSSGASQTQKASNANQAQFQDKQGNFPSGSGGNSVSGMSTGTSGFNASVNGASSSFPNSSLFTQQINNAFSAQQAQQPRASSVAISSLNNSAQSVGMTLEQLAMALASNPARLAKFMSDSASGTESMLKKQELALHLYETECRSMYSKCMLVAGIDPRMCQPGTSTYLQFALKAWQAEGKRLHDLMGSRRNLEPPLDAATGKAASSADSQDASTDDNHGHSHSHDHDNHTENEKPTTTCGARHIHRLDGQCGHKAIIHQPKDRPAHIDFVIGNKVECYDGIEPLGKNFESVWPSKFKCCEYEPSCVTNCARNNKGNYEQMQKFASRNFDVPKIIELSDINLQDPEWNYDVSGSIDGGVMGLFKLGERQDDALSAI